MEKDVVKYSIVDPYTDTVLKGNPAALCWLENIEKDDNWLQSVATEFNMPITCYLTSIVDHGIKNPMFQLRWFTTVVEASPRSGTMNVHLDKKNQRAYLRGKATTVMEGSILV